jgi:hypothetical protein
LRARRRQNSKGEAMSRSVDGLISDIRTRVHSLLHDEVIQHTIVVMRELSSALSALSREMRGGSALGDEQKEKLKDILLPLTSESIREALHKGELPITNGIIRTKNSILTAIGVPIPDGHAEINPNDFPGYNW